MFLLRKQPRLEISVPITAEAQDAKHLDDCDLAFADEEFSNSFIPHVALIAGALLLCRRRDQCRAIEPPTFVGQITVARLSPKLVTDLRQAIDIDFRAGTRPEPASPGSVA